MLDPQQTLVAEQPGSGVLLVTARAGSGKTRTIRARVEYLLGYREKMGFKSRILVMAFSTMVATEIQEHFNRDLTPERLKRVKVGTFHKVSLALIHKNREALETLTGLKAACELRVVGTRDYGREVAEMQHPTLGLIGVELAGFVTKLAETAANKNLSLGELFGQDARLKMTFDRLSLQTAAEDVETLEELIGWLRKRRFAEGKILFSDYLPLANCLPDGSFKHLGYVDVLVDELQDLNHGQRTFVKRLMATAKSLTGLGDAAQCILSFAGAKPTTFEDMAKEYASRGVKSMALNRTYRCGRRIVEAANEVLKNQLKQTDMMLGGNGEGRFEILPGFSLVLPELKACIAEDGHNGVAFLCRTYAAMPALEQILVTAGIPYTLAGGGLFDQVEVRNVLAHLSLASQPGTFSRELWEEVAGSYQNLGVQTAAKALELNPERPWALSTAELRLSKNRQASWQQMAALLEDLERLTTGPSQARGGREIWTSRMQPVVDVLSPHWAAWRDLEQSADAVMSLRIWAESFPEDAILFDMLGQAALIGNGRKGGSDDEAESVTLMTVHKSKGLEFQHVFLWDVAAGRFPMLGNETFTVDEDEEHRLVYVAVTRGIKSLFVVCKDEKALATKWLRPWTEAAAHLAQAVA